MKVSYVYILASKRNGTLYTGVTSDLVKRTYEHKQGLVDSFTKKHDIKLLVYFEEFADIEDALKREKNIKAWKREWKVKTIEEANPQWLDLYANILP